GWKGEQSAAGERAQDLDPGLHRLEHRLGSRVLTGLGQAADLGHGAWHPRDREDTLDQAKPDQPRHGSDEGVQGGEKRGAEESEDDEPARSETIAQRTRI